MRLIDADKFLGFLIFSKHIDSLKCKEVKEAVEMCEVNVLEQIREEINKQAWAIATSDTDRANGMWDAYRIIDKYKGE